MEIIRGKQPGAKKTVIYGPEGIGKSTLAPASRIRCSLIQKVPPGIWISRVPKSQAAG